MLRLILLENIFFNSYENENDLLLTILEIG